MAMADCQSVYSLGDWMNLPGGGVMGLPMEGKCSACNNWPISPPVVIRNGVLCVDCASDYLRWREWPKEKPGEQWALLSADRWFNRHRQSFELLEQDGGKLVNKRRWHSLLATHRRIAGGGKGMSVTLTQNYVRSVLRYEGGKLFWVSSRWYESFRHRSRVFEKKKGCSMAYLP